jgi:hypothetical protein
MENIQEIIDVILKDYDKDWVIKTVLSKTIRSRSPSEATDVQAIAYQAEREFVNKTEIRSNYAFRRGTYGQMSYIVKEKIEQSIVDHIRILVNELVEEGILDKQIYNDGGDITITLSDKYFAKEVEDFSLDESMKLLRQLIQEVAVSKKGISKIAGRLKQKFDEDYVLNLIAARAAKKDDLETKIDVFELEMSITYKVEEAIAAKFRGNIGQRDIKGLIEEIKAHLMDILTTLDEKGTIKITCADGGYYIKLSNAYIESEISNFSLD